MTDTRLRVAIIGLGAWGTRAHLPAFVARSDVEVVALVDVREEVLRSAAAQYGISRTFGEVDELFASACGLDAVVIAAPTDRHHELVQKAFAAGVHVLCEKPLAYDLSQARELAAAAHDSNRVARIGFLFRFSPVVTRMKELVDAGYIGEVQLFESSTLNGQFIGPQKPLHWKMERGRANGGVFVEYGSHSIDLALWFGGPITRGVAHGTTLIPERTDATGTRRAVNVDDAASWIAAYRHGGEALFRTGWASLPVGGGGARVYGARGSLAWHLDPTTRRSEQLIAATIDAPEPKVLFEFTPAFDPDTDAGDFPLGLLARYNARLVESFVGGITTAGQGSGPTFADGLAAQAVLEAIRTSLDESRWVDVEQTGERGDG
jgi:predicted dehydrogenase